MLKYFKVGLDDDFRERIERAAKAKGQSLGEEIRNRLEASLAYDEKQASAPYLYKLLGEIERLADMVKHQRGAEWHADPNATKLFAAAVYQQIVSYDTSFPHAEANALIAALQSEADIGGVLAKELRRTTKDDPVKEGIFGLPRAGTAVEGRSTKPRRGKRR